MHKRIALNFGKFKSRKCSISFSRDYARKGQKNKKAVKNQGFSWLYLFYSPYLVAEMGLKKRREGLSAIRRSDTTNDAVCRCLRTASIDPDGILRPVGLECSGHRA